MLRSPGLCRAETLQIPPFEQLLSHFPATGHMRTVDAPASNNEPVPPVHQVTQNSLVIVRPDWVFGPFHSCRVSRSKCEDVEHPHAIKSPIFRELDAT